MVCTVLGHIEADDHRKALARIEDLASALRVISDQCLIADDPEHMTLSLIRKIAEKELSK